VSLGLFIATNLLAATSQRRYVIKPRARCGAKDLCTRRTIPHFSH
jgi:hypothetical protein